MTVQPYYGIFTPHKDITVYELALLIPFLIPNGRKLNQSTIVELGDAARHFTLFKNENEFQQFVAGKSVFPRE